MVALNCPLCCNESFATASSLKCHILDILDNLMCPTCQDKFESLGEFAEHLESFCGGATEDNDGGEQDTEKSDDLGESLLAKALKGGSKKELDENIAAADGRTEYYCEMCDLQFVDVEEHLNSRHQGQQLIVEEDGANSSGNSSNETTVFMIDPLDLKVAGAKSFSETSPKKTSSSKKTRSANEQDFKDKDGRLYTRKFVKIDKFWLQDDPAKYSTEDDPETIPNEEEDEEETDSTAIEINRCPECGLFFPSAKTLHDHGCDLKGKIIQKLDKSLKEEYNCEVCNTTFPTFKSLRLHRRMHEPVKARGIEAPANYDAGEEPVRRMFICKICNKTYDKEYEAVHTNSHKSDDGFNCEVCNRKFFTKTNLDMHMKAHSNNKKFTCSYCKKPFVTYDALSDHLLNQCHKRAYACQFCGRRFARPHEKVKHERIHTGEKPHVCDICGKAFRVSYCLTLHLRTHSGTRPYQCKHCGKRFKSHSVYNHHLHTHSDVRAYKCPFCPKAFKTSVQLAGHKNSHIKPFTCTECNRPFASLYAVRAHMQTHKREINNLRYECWVCGALYSRTFALRDHLKQQHQLEGDKAKAEVVVVNEELEAANSILVSEEDIILGLGETSNIEIIENEAE